MSILSKIAETALYYDRLDIFEEDALPIEKALDENKSFRKLCKDFKLLNMNFMLKSYRVFFVRSVPRFCMLNINELCYILS